jgi:hypothetical protein
MVVSCTTKFSIETYRDVSTECKYVYCAILKKQERKKDERKKKERKD